MDIFNTIRQLELENLKTILKADPTQIHQKDPRGFSPLTLATYLGNVAITKLLLSYNPNLEAKDMAGNTALMGVCFKGYTEIAELLIEAGADVNGVNATHSTPLIFAAMFGKEAIIKILLAAGADPNLRDKQNMTAKDHAQSRQLEHIVALFS